jgi:hypothetical protein
MWERLEQNMHLARRSQKRQRAGAVQDAPRQLRLSLSAPASWSAVALHRFLIGLVLLTNLFKFPARAELLPLPPRSASALTASQLATNASFLTTNLVARENFIRTQILTGNVPDFLRQLTPVTLTDLGAGGTNIVTIYVTPNYLALGSDTDFVLMPMTPETAQRIADVTDSILPTRKIVDAIYASATVKLPPQPLPPDARMTTPPVFLQHNQIVRTQLLASASSPNALSAGHKKDVVITPRLTTATNKVAIYGWHRTNGVAIQPLYLGHTSAWVDYSHGIRLVSQIALLNGQRTNLAALLANPELCHLLSDEGVLTQARYPGIPEAIPLSSGRSLELGWPIGFKMSETSDELTHEFHQANGVRILINTPPFSSYTTNKPLRLICYALPNGNTIEQTIGKQLQPEDDERFNIQHIGAQTRFLRQMLTNEILIVAYLENSLLSWPAWRRTNGNQHIPALFDTIRGKFPTLRRELILTGHSGGGSLIFGYLDAVSEIPRDIKRIAFLDSNYAYETTNHFTKLVNWLKQTGKLETSLTASKPTPNPSQEGNTFANAPLNAPLLEEVGGGSARDYDSVHHLTVLAYHDSIALLDGKAFVSERGGTWGRSHAMLTDLRREFSFTSHTNHAGLQSHIAADGRIHFLLKENPEHEILHTIQVERNGFIHALLTGTPRENHGYEYFGERVYERWIQEE